MQLDGGNVSDFLSGFGGGGGVPVQIGRRVIGEKVGVCRVITEYLSVILDQIDGAKSKTLAIS